MSVTRITSDRATLPPAGQRVMVLHKPQGSLPPRWDFAELHSDWSTGGGFRDVFQNYNWHRDVSVSDFIAWMPEPPTDLAEERSVEGWADAQWFDGSKMCSTLMIVATDTPRHIEKKCVRVRVTPIQESK